MPRLKAACQHCPLNCLRPELSHGCVYGEVGFPPAPFWVGELGLPIHPLPRDELLDTYADATDSRPLGAEPLVQLQSLRIDLIGDIRRSRHGRRSGQLGEIGESYRDRDGAAQHALLTHSAGGAVRHPKQLTTYRIGVVGVPAKRLLGADAVLWLHRGNPAAVSTPCEFAQHATGMRTECGAQSGSWSVSQLADGEDPQAMKLLCSGVADSPHRLDRKWMQEGDDLLRWNLDEPIGLGRPRGHFGNELCRTNPNRASDLLFVRDDCADILPDLHRPAEHPDGTGQIQKGLVDRRRLDHSCNRPEYRDNRFRHCRVAIEIGRKEDRVRGETPGLSRGDAGPYAFGPCLVGRREHYT